MGSLQVQELIRHPVEVHQGMRALINITMKIVAGITLPTNKKHVKALPRFRDVDIKALTCTGIELAQVT